MSKNNKVITITRSYEEKIPHSIYGGPRYANSGLFASFSQEIPANIDAEMQKQVSKDLFEKAYIDVKRAKKELVEKIQEQAQPKQAQPSKKKDLITKKQKDYVERLALETEAPVPDIDDDFPKEDARKLIDELKKTKAKKKAKQDKKDSKQQELYQKEADNFLPNNNEN